MIDDGKIAKEGSPKEIINDPSLKGYNFE